MKFPGKLHENIKSINKEKKRERKNPTQIKKDHV